MALLHECVWLSFIIQNNPGSGNLGVPDCACILGREQLKNVGWQEEEEKLFHDIKVISEGVCNIHDDYLDLVNHKIKNTS